jgi:hypothetical protein
MDRRALSSSYIVGTGTPMEIVVESPVCHHHAFGTAGRAGGVNHVGQIIRCDRISGIIRPFFGDDGPITIQTDRVHGRRGQVVDEV